MGRKSFIIILCALLALPVLAQEAGLNLAVRRLFGYGGGDQIQGRFRLELIDPPPLASVTFKIDDSAVATVKASPFLVDFDTGQYALGWHDLSADGQTPDGQTLTSQIRRFEFVSAEAGWVAARNIVIPIFAVVGAVLVLGLGSQLWFTLRGSKSTSPLGTPLGTPRKYGLLGGGICPKCRRPFSLHWWSFNAVGGKFDRCDHCGKWSFVRRESREKLTEAEAAELALAQPETPIAEMTEAEKFKQRLEDSRFDNQ